MQEVKPIIRSVLRILVVVLTFVFFAQKIVFINADLGRHLENGKVFLQHFKPISTNYYSFTEPEFPVINHHWGSGVLLYLVYGAFGFTGLSVFYCIVSAITVLLFYLVAEKRSNSYLSFLYFMLCIPIISSRVEIRPELFSMLFLGVYVFLFERYKAGAIPFRRLLMVIPLIQLLWVNLHIFFAMGLLLILIYGLSDLINKKKGIVKNYSLLLGFSGIACLLNPAGLAGALTPLTIFNNYAYMIAENQSLTFMQERFGDPVYLHFEGITLLVLFIVFMVGYRLRPMLVKYTGELLCLLVFSALAFKAIRGIPIAAYFMLAFTPVLVSDLLKTLTLKNSKRVLKISAAFSGILLLISIGKADSYLSVKKERAGFGLYTKITNSANFFKLHHITGPLFNNYDIGGYLIFSLFPQERVFVDNRPEAYSDKFFTEVYNPMLENEEAWRKADSTYHFNCIYFFRLDETPNGQPFLIRRLADRANWAPIYVDAVAILFLKRTEQNKGVIEQFELPPSMFNSRPAG